MGFDMDEKASAIDPALECLPVLSIPGGAVSTGQHMKSSAHFLFFFQPGELYAGSAVTFSRSAGRVSALELNS